MVIGSMVCEHRVHVIVAIALHSLVDDCLKDLQARIRRKPFALTQDGPPAPFVLKAVCLTSHRLSPYTQIPDTAHQLARRAVNLIWLIGMFLV